MSKKQLSDKQRLNKKAAAKFLSTGLSIKLLKNNPKSSLYGSYQRSYYCAARLDQEGNKIRSKYCKNRWCAVCNRIRTAKIMNGYLPAIKQLQEIEPCFFVTLTKTSVTGSDLNNSIELMESVWRKIMTSKANRKLKVIGLRKAECTIRPNGHYHYHYHVVIQGKNNAEWLVESWLKRLVGKAKIAAQDIRILNQDSLHEIFKYFTKLTTSKKDKTEERELYDPTRMDIMFRAIKGKRVFQSFGGLKQVTEEIEEIITEEYNEIEPANKEWTWYADNYFDTDGVALTSYKPADKLKKMLDNDLSDKLLDDLLLPRTIISNPDG